jgi:hypothetical protein
VFADGTPSRCVHNVPICACSLHLINLGQGATGPVLMLVHGMDGMHIRLTLSRPAATPTFRLTWGRTHEVQDGRVDQVLLTVQPPQNQPLYNNGNSWSILGQIIAFNGVAVESQDYRL